VLMARLFVECTPNKEEKRGAGKKEFSKTCLGELRGGKAPKRKRKKKGG